MSFCDSCCVPSNGKTVLSVYVGYVMSCNTVLAPPQRGRSTNRKRILAPSAPEDETRPSAPVERSSNAGATAAAAVKEEEEEKGYGMIASQRTSHADCLAVSVPAARRDAHRLAKAVSCPVRVRTSDGNEADLVEAAQGARV